MIRPPQVSKCMCSDPYYWFKEEGMNKELEKLQVK
jgi:hypothetical protein